MNQIIITLCLMFIASSAFCAEVAQADFDGPSVERFIQLKTRTEVNLPSYVIRPRKIEASVILFAGGGGQLNISDTGIGKDGNFLIRSRYKFAHNNLFVFIPDVASDQDDLIRKRTGKDHIADVKAMIRWLREQNPGKPVWLIGTSRGTISAASVAAVTTGTDAPDGIVLSATVTRPSKSGKDTVYSTKVKEISVPTLLVHHKDDACYVTPYADIPELYNALEKVKIKQIKSFSGGQSNGHKCRARSYHGFNGIEDDVVNYISQWIKSHL